MKNVNFRFGVIAALGIGILSFINVAGGTVKGIVIPGNGASKCWAVSGKDTFQSNIVSGAFQLNNLKAGVYRIAIETMPPYKNVVRDGVAIRDGEVTDLGEIRLQQ